MKKRMTLKDVAEAAEVSMTTASFVLNGRGSISNLIRKRVLGAARDIGYSPKRKQKEILRAESFAVLLDISNRRKCAWTFYDPIIQGLDSIFLEAERRPVLIPCDSSTSGKEVIDQLHAIDCRMVFSLECVSSEVISLLEAQKIKVIVLLDSRMEGEFHTVCQDDMQASYKGMLHVLERGHRRIWIAERTPIYTPKVSEDRFFGYKKALDEWGVDYLPEWRFRFKGVSHEELGELTAKIVSAKERPTAIMVHDDYVANKLMMHLLAAGLSIPNDLSIISHGDVLDYELGDPFSITTMRLDTYAIGQLAAQAMLNRIRNKEDELPKSLKLCSTLVDRGSVKEIESNLSARASA